MGRANENGAELAVIWAAVPDKEILRGRMQARRSMRDIWKLAHFDEYYESIILEPPRALLEQGTIDKLVVFEGDFEGITELARKFTSQL